MQNKDLAENSDLYKAVTYTLNSDGGSINAGIQSKNIPSARSQSSDGLDQKIVNQGELTNQFRAPTPPDRKESNQSNISEDFFTD